MSANEMFVNRLNALKAWPSQTALDKSLPVATGQTGIVAGSVIHMDPTAKAFKLGSVAGAMPMFAWVGQAENDAIGGGAANISSYGNQKGVTGLVATGGFELETTEFVASGNTFAPNTPLTPATGGDLGKVTEGVYYTNDICGIVSNGKTTNAHNVSVVAFWTYFLPATA
jgi:hypothetical protein